MPSATRIRRARKVHQCTERSYHAIRPGDLYLYAECPPWHDMGDGRKWWYIRACLRCSDEFGLHTSETRKQLSDNSLSEKGTP